MKTLKNLSLNSLVFLMFLAPLSARAVDVSRFHFALYASGEYSRMLESQWEEKAD